MDRCESHSQVLLMKTVVALPGCPWANEVGVSYSFILWKHDMFKKGTRDVEEASMGGGGGTGECVKGCFLKVAITSCSHTMADMAKLGWKQNEASSSSCKIYRSLCQWLLSSIDVPCSVYPDFRRQNNGICPLPKLLRRSGSWGVRPKYLIFSQCIFLIVSYLRASFRLNTWISLISHEVAGRMKSSWTEKEKKVPFQALA